MTSREKILDFIEQFQAEHGWAPTIREVAEGVGLSSTSTVHVHLHSLERDGLIERGPGARQLRVIA